MVQLSEIEQSAELCNFTIRTLNLPLFFVALFLGSHKMQQYKHVRIRAIWKTA